MKNPENNKTSFELAKKFLGQSVQVTMDRPLGSKHPKHGFVYEANYGYIAGIEAPDGEDLDAYFLGVDEPLQQADGVCIAIAHRRDNDDDKLIVVPAGVSLFKKSCQLSIFKNSGLIQRLLGSGLGLLGHVAIKRGY